MDKFDKKSFLGSRLKKIRTERGLTQKQIAEVLGISERGYQNYELGARFPLLDTLVPLAKFYNIPFGDLLFDAPPNFDVNLPIELIPVIEDFKKTAAEFGLSRNDCMLYMFVYTAIHGF